MIRFVVEFGGAAIVLLVLGQIALKQFYALRATRRELERQEATSEDHAHETATH